MMGDFSWFGLFFENLKKLLKHVSYSLFSLSVIPTVHLCSIDGDSENHTALDLKLVFPLIVIYSIMEQVIYISLLLLHCHLDE